jgi:hypothetical protein
MPDWRPADLLTFVDGNRLREAWFRDQDTLCVGCRTRLLGSPVNYFVRYDPGFPDPNSQDALDAVLNLRDVSGRFSNDSQMFTMKHDINWNEFARQWRTARDQISAVIFSRLKVIPPDKFARLWFYIYPSLTSIKTGSFPSKQAAPVTRKWYVTGNGKWWRATKSLGGGYHGGIETDATPIRWGYCNAVGSRVA